MRKTVAALLTALVALAVLVVPADADAPPPRAGAAPYGIKPFTTYASDLDRLERAWAAWQARDLDRYATVVTRSCFCLETRDVRTEVRGERVTSVTKVGSERQLRRRGHEIEALYRLLRQSFRDAARVDVTFRRGVPVTIFIDGDERIADDEYGYRVRLR